MQPRILIDGHDLWKEHGTGIATYARNLAMTAKSLGAETSLLVSTAPRSLQDPLLAEIEFYDPRWPKWFIRLGGRGQFAYRSLRALLSLLNPISVSEIPIQGQVVNQTYNNRLRHFDHLLAGTDLFETARRHFQITGKRLKIRTPERVDIAHWTSPIPIEIVGAKNIYTIHDLIPLRLPYTTLDDKQYYLKLTRHLAANADHIVTISHQSMADIVELLGCPAEKVTMTYQSSDVASDRTSLLSVGYADRIKRLYNLTAGKYFLFVGARDPKKNIQRLLEAHLSANSDLPLAIVGPRGWETDERMSLMTSNAITKRKKRVRLLESVPQQQLIDLLLGARALIFPSLYEGFGLPVLEAMSLGTPVITSTAEAIREVGGDAVIYVDPYKVHDIREAIERISTDDTLAEDLKQKGLEQAKLFSAESYSLQLKNLYSKVLTNAQS